MLNLTVHLPPKRQKKFKVRDGELQALRAKSSSTYRNPRLGKNSTEMFVEYHLRFSYVPLSTSMSAFIGHYSSVISRTNRKDTCLIALAIPWCSSWDKFVK